MNYGARLACLSSPHSRSYFLREKPAHCITDALQHGNKHLLRKQNVVTTGRIRGSVSSKPTILWSWNFLLILYYRVELRKTIFVGSMKSKVSTWNQQNVWLKQNQSSNQNNLRRLCKSVFFLKKYPLLLAVYSSGLRSLASLMALDYHLSFPHLGWFPLQYDE